MENSTNVPVPSLRNTPFDQAPWEHDDGFIYRADTDDDDDEEGMVAEVYGTTDQAQLANGRLIAAAPELLFAMWALLELVPENHKAAIAARKLYNNIMCV